MEQRAAASPTRVSLASYNIHGCVGRDGHYDRERILAVLNELDADIVALQEVETTRDGVDLLHFLSEGTGSRSLLGSTLLRGEGHYGNAVLTRLPVVNVDRIDLTYRRREPRGALLVDIRSGPLDLRVVATHLGLLPNERRFQARRLLEVPRSDSTAPIALMGDLNEWFLWGRPLRWLHRRFAHAPSPPTFPARFPLLALDRILVRPREALVNLTVHLSELSRIASDHLPLKAIIELAHPEGTRSNF